MDSRLRNGCFFICVVLRGTLRLLILYLITETLKGMRPRSLGLSQKCAMVSHTKRELLSNYEKFDIPPANEIDDFFSSPAVSIRGLICD